MASNTRKPEDATFQQTHIIVAICVGLACLTAVMEGGSHVGNSLSELLKNTEQALHQSNQHVALMEDKPLSPKWFIQAMALLGVAGMTIPLVAGVAGFIKDELRRPAAIERMS